ncbi:MAG TPA: bifunctional UDP-sugar hydrolase/5'-nucleotidase [Polyangiaceae bacterium]|jgi:5'-nucleotidase
MGLAAASSAGSWGCSSDPGPAVSSPCPPGKTCQVNLTLLHTSDIHSRLFDYDLLITQVDGNLGLGTTGEIKTVGGIARMSYVINRERARADRVLHLDSGDIWQGAPIFNFFSGEPEVRAMNQIFPDAMAIGNHEFDIGALNVATQFDRWADFPVLAANYKFPDPTSPLSTRMSGLLTPFQIFNEQGLKVAVIGMGNLSTLGSLFSQPNSLGMVPLNTVEVAQTYIDLLRPSVDVIILLTHLGLEVDEAMVRGTTGIDIVLGGHNHIVINPPQEIQDCTVETTNPGYVWATDPNVPYDTNNPPPAYDCSQDPSCHSWQCTSACTNPNTWIALPDPVNHPYAFQRPCSPRRVFIEHSGAFAKYVGRDDLVLSNDPADIQAANPGEQYDPVNGFEIISNDYRVFPIDTTVPEDPVMVDLLQPYKRSLNAVADLSVLVGFSPQGSKRSAPQGGDAALGNLVATAMWLRLGVQTDFSLTNTSGIRTDLNPGPVTIEEMYNIVPFNNAITKMQLSGLEVEELFDFVARRSLGRGCVSQAQIAGARVRLNCAGCNRPDAIGPCQTDADCIGGTDGSCQNGQCNVSACAEQIFIGHRSCTTDADCATTGEMGSTCANKSGGKGTGTCTCTKDADCGSPAIPGICDLPVNGNNGLCSSPTALENIYELATSDYLAGGGSGYRVLQRNTTQNNTMIQQRDALDDWLRQGRPCGYSAGNPGTHGLPICTTDADCNPAGTSGLVCACASHSHEQFSGGTSACTTDSGGCASGTGECVRQDCRDQVAQFHDKACQDAPNLTACETDLNSCSLAGEECKFLSCIDEGIGNLTDNRVEMIGR